MREPSGEKQGDDFTASERVRRATWRPWALLT